MKATIASVMLLAFAVTAPLAHAASDGNFSGFTLTHTGGSLGQDGLQVMADNGNTVQIALLGAGPSINPVYAISTEYESSNGDAGWTQLGGKVKQGYQITSITVSGVLSGSLDIGQPGIDCGTDCTSYAGAASNSGGATLNLTSNGNVISTQSQLADVTSPRVFSSTWTGALDGDFTLDIDTILNAYARSTRYTIDHDIDNEIPWTEHLFWTSESLIALADLTLTVQVSPVPEPGTYAMLLAGLGVVGFAARPRRRKQ